MATQFNGFSSVTSNAAYSLNFAQFTICGWVRRTGGDPYSEVITVGAGETSPMIRREGDGSPADLAFFYNFDGTPGVWFLGGIPESTWFSFAVSYDRTNVANDPVSRINCINIGIFEAQTPVGTAVAPSAGYQLGGGNPIAGQIAYLQVFNVILNAREMDGAVMRPGSITRGLKLFRRLQDATDTKDFSGNGGHGTTNTDLETSTRMPGNCVPVWKTRRRHHVQPTPVAGGQAVRTMHTQRMRRA